MHAMLSVICSMLKSSKTEHQMAAALVLGEVAPKEPAVDTQATDGLPAPDGERPELDHAAPERRSLCGNQAGAGGSHALDRARLP